MQAIEYYFLFRANKVQYLRSLGVRIGDGCDLLNSIENYGSEPWLIQIGNRVTVTSGTWFITHDASSRLFRSTLPDHSKFGNRFGRILIHDNCFIGINSIILPNVQIGPNSIVGAGSVVTKDVAPNIVVTGVPAREIMKLDEYITKYEQKMVPHLSNDRSELRKQLTHHFWNEER